MGQSGIYACDDDMLAVYEVAERNRALTYVRMGNHASRAVETWRHGRDLPCLGREESDTSVRSVSWLVSKLGSPPGSRRVDLPDGRVCYAIDQLGNPDTIEVTPGGLLTDGVVLSGRIATVWDTPYAKALMNAFRSAVRKSFERIGAYWVGPAAARVLDSGGRLTIATQSPPQFNLVRG